MNIFGFITIGLVFVSVLLIYYVEIPRRHKEIRDSLGCVDRLISQLWDRSNSIWSDVEAIKSARGTFSRQLGELVSLVHSIGDKVDNETFFRRKLGDKLDIYSTAMNSNFIAIQGYLDSLKPKTAEKAKKETKPGK